MQVAGSGDPVRRILKNVVISLSLLATLNGSRAPLLCLCREENYPGGYRGHLWSVVMSKSQEVRAARAMSIEDY